MVATNASSSDPIVNIAVEGGAVAYTAVRHRDTGSLQDFASPDIFQAVYRTDTGNVVLFATTNSGLAADHWALETCTP